MRKEGGSPAGMTRRFSAHQNFPVLFLPSWAKKRSVRMRLRRNVLESVECDVPDLIAGTFTRTVLKGQFWPLSPSAMRQVAIMQKIAGGTHAPA